MKALTQKTGMTLVELMVVITIIAILAAILLPALARARDAALRVRCASNMRQLSQACLMYTNEHKGMYPACFPNVYWGDPATYSNEPRNYQLPFYGRHLIRNNYSLDARLVFPDYLTSLQVFVCPGSNLQPPEVDANTWYADVTFTAQHIYNVQTDSMTADDVRRKFEGPPRPDTECMTNQMYSYLPYAVVTNEQALWLWDELDYRMANGETGFFDNDLSLVVNGGHAPGGGDIYYRLRDSVSRFFIKDVNSPTHGAMGDSEIPVLYDTLWNQGTPSISHMTPLGGNVLYMDGHVEFQRYPNPYDRIPYTQDFMEWMRANAYDNHSLMNVPPWCGNRLPDAPFEPRYRYYPDDPLYEGVRFQDTR